MYSHLEHTVLFFYCWCVCVCMYEHSLTRMLMIQWDNNVISFSFFSSQSVPVCSLWFPLSPFCVKWITVTCFVTSIKFIGVENCVIYKYQSHFTLRVIFFLSILLASSLGRNQPQWMSKKKTFNYGHLNWVAAVRKRLHRQIFSLN